MCKVSLNQLTITTKSNFFNLFEKSLTEAGKFCKRYSKDDARCDFFKVYSELNLWLLVQLDDFLEALSPISTKISKYLRLTDNDRVQFLLQYDTINRASYVTHAMFEVEYFLRSMMESLGMQPKGGYFGFTKDLLSFIKINDPQKHKILNAPAQLRNSLHNSGYSKHDFEITLQGRLYKFVKGKKVDFAGWDNLYIMFDELLDFLIEIIENPKVKQVKLIPHASDYAQHV